MDGRYIKILVPMFIGVTASCTDFCPETPSDDAAVRFDVSTEPASEFLTRSDGFASPALLKDESGTTMLYIHALIQDNADAPELSTRALPVGKDNFDEEAAAFTVNAVTESGLLFMKDEVVKSHSSGSAIWSPDETRYWPGNENVGFYAYAYGRFSGTDIPMSDVSYDGKRKVEFSYTSPSSAEAQPDLMLAANVCDRSTAGGTVPLRFSHAFSAITFQAGDISGGVVKTITLSGINGSGKCVYDAGTASYSWASSDPSSFSQEFNVKVSDEQSVIQDITSERPRGTFMVIPQTLGHDASVEVVLQTNDGNAQSLKASLSGKVWEAGKVYNYIISSDSINWVYVFNVTKALTLPLGTTSGQYQVTSYRYRAQDPSVRQPVAWSAVKTKDIDKDLAGGSGDSGNHVIEFTESGAGGVSGAVTYGIGLTKTYMHTTWDNDEQHLRANAPKGSPGNPYDLATRGGTAPETTANSYVVDSYGTYSLPLVYGNARKNGTNNPSAYTGAENTFYDYQNRAISSPYIYDSYTPADCVLVWADAFWMFTDVRLSADRRHLEFTVNKDNLQQANAILAVRDASGNIMWSWHIWVTEHDMGNVYRLQDWQDGSNDAYGLMPYTLGWIDGKMVYYSERNISYLFTQDRSGKTATMDIRQEGDAFDYQDSGSLYYQWGRKDPFISLRNRRTLGKDDYRRHEVGRSDYAYGYEARQVDIGDAIRHPNIYYLSGDDKGGDKKWLKTSCYYLWCNNHDYDNDNAKTSVKTVYDPSPVGFRVPVPRAFDIFVNSHLYSTSVKNSLNGDYVASGYEYDVYTEKNKGGSRIRLIATGQRADRVSGLGNGPGALWAMEGVYFWSCVGKLNGADNIGRSLCIRKDVAGGMTSLFPGSQTMARPVRPIQDR